MVRIFRSKPDAGTVVQPETAALGLFLRNLQPLTPPDPLDPFDVHHPARTVQHHRDTTIPVAAVLESEREDVGGQRRFIVRCRGNLALRRSILTQNPARPPFGNAKLSHNMIDASATACGA